MKTDSMSDIALQIAALPKENKQRSRIVIITQGKDEVLLAQGIKHDAVIIGTNSSIIFYFYSDGKIQSFKTTVLSAEQIVDTNGAGDAFVGGNLHFILSYIYYKLVIRNYVKRSQEMFF